MHIHLFLGDCDVVVQYCWVLLFDPKENECLSSYNDLPSSPPPLSPLLLTLLDLFTHIAKGVWMIFEYDSITNIEQVVRITEGRPR
jgi:hypothetical protein